MQGSSSPARTDRTAEFFGIADALHELDGRVASKTSLFDDPALEIAEISGLIKQHLGRGQAFWNPGLGQHPQEEISQIQSPLGEVRRIDLDTEVAATNVEQAHIQIKKFQKHISGNRSLIIKSFLVLFFFIVLFGTVLR
ncbi:hypothetical protein EMIHUDRAFT_247449 [Emiliania huxleyi CCMP1516]|uniref:t-SNARE coiled-coil homology domain-containing protein n=2 Tax=Emiliania huxleyi TaxID=2903 RepID=A0A0D3IML4_EMIH1|nr:hypothetical protein EMIHUDRAFT_247449 [Emiliania huxleyi CCMP1516]EOD12499.1 hypothetical protein EMIHUDRAFT_247449 [Emiliania huxleyi CCMP1516]|eukprot:XP_005764928.1 hypothetical protein EMIHUDRAFT_247449 [Emiliania huxleyi CCMP1516]